MFLTFILNFKFQPKKIMQLKIYNSLSAEKEIFTPINGNKVGMYVCGPNRLQQCAPRK